MNITNENKILVIGENTENRVNEIIESYVPKKSQKMFVLNLNQYSTSRLSTLKTKMNDFIKNQPIFNNYPKILVAKDLNYSNENIQLVYSKMISLLPDDMIMIASCTSTANLPKNIVIISNIIHVDSDNIELNNEEFWSWVNNESIYLKPNLVSNYIDKNFLEDYMREYKFGFFQKMCDMKASNMRNEFQKLILKTI